MTNLEIQSVADGGETVAAKVITGCDDLDAMHNAQIEIARLASAWPEAHHSIIDQEGFTILTEVAR